MKIYICCTIPQTPAGGSFQFFKAFRKYLEKQKLITTRANNADIIVCNSFQNNIEALQLKRQYPDTIFVHRVDGPIRLYNTLSDKRDAIVYTLNNYIMDATIFQSNYSQQSNYALGFPKQSHETLIMNAPDPDCFYPKQYNDLPKTKIIATSWSSNWKKGFKVYQWLDEHLDFSKYSMTFVGNAPTTFKNIKHIPPVTSDQLGELLRQHDIYITASEKEACSNALLEALHCGLPAIYFNDGSHSELVQSGGLGFKTNHEIINNLEIISKNYTQFVEQINVPSFNKTMEAYIDYLRTLYNKKKSNQLKPKVITKPVCFYIKSKLILYRYLTIFRKAKTKLLDWV